MIRRLLSNARVRATGHFVWIASTYVLMVMMFWVCLTVYDIKMDDQQKDTIANNLLIEYQVVVDLKSAESAELGWILSGDLDGYRSEYLGSVAALDYDLKVLHEFVARDSFERQKSAELQELVARKRQEMTAQLKAFRTGDLAAAQVLVKSDAMINTMQQIKQTVDFMRARDQVQLARSRAKSF